MKKKYNISVIIPVRDDLLLEEALRSIVDDVEVVISLNAPSKKVKEICKKWILKEKCFTLKISETKKVGMSAALNAGVLASSNDKIVVLDSDCTLVSKTLYFYNEYLNLYPFVRGVAKVKNVNKFWYKQTKLGVESVNKLMKTCPQLFGPAIAFRKTEYMTVGGYDEDILYGCDHDFSRRIIKKGYKIGFCEQAVIWHKPISYKTDRKSHIGYGRGNKISDLKNHTNNGLKYIFSKVYLSSILDKFKTRGIGGIIRTFMQFIWMIEGYFFIL